MTYAQFKLIIAMLAVNKECLKPEWAKVETALELAISGHPFSSDIIEVAWHIHENVLN